MDETLLTNDEPSEHDDFVPLTFPASPDYVPVFRWWNPWTWLHERPAARVGRRLGTYTKQIGLGGAMEMWSTHDSALASYEASGYLPRYGGVCLLCGAGRPYGMYGSDGVEGDTCACEVRIDPDNESQWKDSTVAYNYRSKRWEARVVEGWTGYEWTKEPPLKDPAWAQWRAMAVTKGKT